MAKKLFGGKESYSEELKEAKALKFGKISEKGFVKGEKSEGHKDEEKNPSKIAKAIKSGKKTPEQYASEESKEMKMKKGGCTKMASGGKVKKMAMGGAAPTSTRIVDPAMPGSPAAGGMRGGMRGGRRTPVLPGNNPATATMPNLPGLNTPLGASLNVGPAGLQPLSVSGSPYKKGGCTKKMASGGKASQLSKANGCAIRGKSRGKIV